MLGAADTLVSFAEMMGLASVLILGEVLEVVSPFAIHCAFEHRSPSAVPAASHAYRQETCNLKNKSDVAVLVRMLVKPAAMQHIFWLRKPPLQEGYGV